MRQPATSGARVDHGQARKPAARRKAPAKGKAPAKATRSRKREPEIKVTRTRTASNASVRKSKLLGAPDQERLPRASRDAWRIQQRRHAVSQSTV